MKDEIVIALGSLLYKMGDYFPHDIVSYATADLISNLIRYNPSILDEMKEEDYTDKIQMTLEELYTFLDWMDASTLWYRFVEDCYEKRPEKTKIKQNKPQLEVLKVYDHILSNLLKLDNKYAVGGVIT